MSSLSRLSEVFMNGTESMVSAPKRLARPGGAVEKHRPCCLGVFSVVLKGINLDRGCAMKEMSRRARRPIPRPPLEEGAGRVWMPPGRRTLSRFLFWSGAWHRKRCISFLKRCISY